jgi:nitrite reductase/ring-hydroxylating ferredoxin subunit
VRLDSGDFLALSARDAHSDCWVPWRPEVEFEGRVGWFRDPCHGSTYDGEGVRVFGPAPRDLDRYPVEVRDGHVYVTLSDDARIPGDTRVGLVDPSATPTPGVPPQSTAVATSTALATATPTPAATEVITPAVPGEGSPFDGADLVAALAANGLGYGPQDHGVGCTGAGALGGAYGTAGYGGDSTWPGFTLWVYPSPEALRADWELPASGPPKTKLKHCPLESAHAYWNENLLLVLGDDRLWVGHEELREQITTIFLALGGDAAALPPLSTAEPVEPMTIRLPGEGGVGLGDLTVEESLAGRVTVFAAGELCSTFEAAAGLSFVVGTPDQPDACHRDGTVLDLVDGSGFRLAQTFTFNAGAVEPFENFGPYPPGVAYPDYICDFLDAEGIERPECQVVRPPSGGQQ